MREHLLQQDHPSYIKAQTKRLLRARYDLLVLFYVFSLLGCTDASLYHRSLPPVAADRVAIEGRICTEDPEQNRFPARLIIMVDQAQGGLFSDYDPGQKRLQVLNGLIQTALSKPEYSVAVFGYSGRVSLLAPEEGLFTRNPGILLNAVTRLSLPEGCIGDQLCRDYQGGLRAVNTLIEDDLASMEPGQRSVTQYTVLWLAAGPQIPLALNRDCCARGDRTCARAEGAERPSSTCQAQLDIDLVQDLRNGALEAGAGGFQLHVLHLASEDSDTNRQMTQLFEQLTFAGGGRYARFGSANQIDPRAVSVFDRPSDMEAAQVIIVNQSAAPRLGGLLADSDGDGLADEEEDLNQNGKLDEGESDPHLVDTDGDGISDLIESKVGFSHTTIDRPIVCEDLYLVEGIAKADRDFDGLNECEERLMGTRPSLSDSDGDNIPDGVEIRRGTDHLNPDSAEDFDEDGVSNGDEVKEGTDPRSIDESQRLGLAARYSVEREGRIRALEADPLSKLEAFRVVDINHDLNAGLAAIHWESTPNSDEQLGFISFKTPSEQEFGQPIPITKSGRYRVYGDVISEGMATVNEEEHEGNAQPLNSSDRMDINHEETLFEWVDLEVNAALLPELEFTENFLLRQRERSCLSFIVRNVRLIETKPLEGDIARGRSVGANELMIYFSQKPARQSEVPGRFRIARVPIYYRAPDQREPSGAKLVVEESEFVSPRIDNHEFVLAP